MNYKLRQWLLDQFGALLQVIEDGTVEFLITPHK